MNHIILASTMQRRDGAVKTHTFTEKTDVTFYPMENSEILSYIQGKDYVDKAGAYGIQGEFAVYVKKIDGDYNNVVGLPLGRLYQELKGMGVLPE